MTFDIRFQTWLQPGLSWAEVVAELVNAFDSMGPEFKTYIVSTNGVDQSMFKTPNKMTDSIIGLQKFGPGKKPIFAEITYTVPQNFPSRFLQNSKHKCAIYNYETYPKWVDSWKKYYHLVDFYFPSSNFSAEIFHLNNVPIEKIFVIPHGVNTELFNTNVKPIKLKTEKKFRYLCVSAPHYRKKINLLLEAYCKSFTKKDDVCLVLKTKMYKKDDKNRKPFEALIGNYIYDMKKKYGNNMPEIEIIDGHVRNIASIYATSQCHVTTTGSEGWGMICSNAMAMNMINIAPRYSGLLHFMNDSNSLLSDVKIVQAKREEQYWTYNKDSKICEVNTNHFSELMIKAYKEYDLLLEKFKPEMKKTVEKYSWQNAAKEILKAINKEIPHYIPGTYKLI